jgi:hypothetical protein
VTISPAYYGQEAITDGGYEVRPVGTRKMVILDDEGELQADTVTVFYWQYPEPLYHDSQPIRLPETSVLEALVKYDCLGGVEKRQKEAAEYRTLAEQNMGDLTMLAPAEHQPAIPRTQSGTQFRFGRVR